SARVAGRRRRAALGRRNATPPTRRSGRRFDRRRILRRARSARLRHAVRRAGGGAADGDRRLSEQPRVLFLTASAFNTSPGGGIPCSPLFRDWPREGLATAHNDPVPTSDDVCHHYYRLGPQEVSRWPHGIGARARAAAGAAVAPVAAAPGGVLRRMKPLVIGNAWPDCGQLTPALESWIAAFRPELLYTILGSIGMMEL